MSKPVGKLLIIGGLPAAGKDSVISGFITRNPHYNFITTHTSRPIRKGEVTGIHYHFVTVKQFKDLINNDRLLEHVKTGLYYKGTSKEEFNKIFKGQNLIWRIDLTRFVSYEETILNKFENHTAQTIITNSTKIFIKPENKRVALGRYQQRDDTSKLEDFHIRWNFEIKYLHKNKHKVPHIVINRTGQLDQAVQSIEKILKV